MSLQTTAGVVAALVAAVVVAGCQGGGDQAASKGGDVQNQAEAPVADTSTQSPSDRLHEIMMRPMQNMSMSGNVDKDFATMMADHHQQAIDMAKLEVEHGVNDELKSMAQSMIDQQTQEREKLLSIAASETKTSSSSEASNQMHEIMMRPMQDMTMSGDIDKDFATQMAAHHESAIKMSQIEVKSGSNAELKAMAQKMIDDQTKERTRLLELAK